MANESNLYDPNTIGPHKGSIGELYDRLCLDRYLQVSLAVDLAETTLIAQIESSKRAMITVQTKQHSSQNNTNQSSPINTEYDNVSNARQAVKNAVESNQLNLDLG